MEDDPPLDPEAVDQILKKLEAYGDTVVGGSSKVKKRKLDKGSKINVAATKKAKISQRLVTNSNPVQGDQSSLKKKRRKNKKKKEKEEIPVVKPGNTVCEGDLENEMDDIDDIYDDDIDDEEEEEEAVEQTQKKDSKSARLKTQAQLMAEELGLVSFKKELQNRSVQEEKQTGAKAGPEVVVFRSHKRKEKKEPEVTKEDTERPRTKFTLESDEFDMKKARFEVRKYGIAGFHGDQKEEAMTALLIKLGAKPPKNKYVNYKEYQEQRKQQKVDEKQKREIDRKMGFKVKRNEPEKKRRDKNDIGHLDGQVGRWKNGVQVIKKDDLKGFNKSKVKY